MEIKLIEENAIYLGDSVYVTTDQINCIWLYTSNGQQIDNKICLDPDVLEAFKNTVFPDNKS